MKVNWRLLTVCIAGPILFALVFVGSMKGFNNIVYRYLPEGAHIVGKGFCGTTTWVDENGHTFWTVYSRGKSATLELK